MTARWQELKSFVRRALSGISQPRIEATPKSVLRGRRPRSPLAVFDPLTGQHLGHYQVLEKIGQGGMRLFTRPAIPV
jgi:hypothetical protein